MVSPNDMDTKNVKVIIYFVTANIGWIVVLNYLFIKYNFIT